MSGSGSRSQVLSWRPSHDKMRQQLPQVSLLRVRRRNSLISSMSLPVMPNLLRNATQVDY